MDISATTRLLTLLGDPVAHSFSPVFQNAAIRHAGHNAVYTALRCDAQSVAPLIRALCRGGGGGNVTVPHKHAAAQCIERPTDAVTRTGACNTFWGEDGIICGDNTDVIGFRRAVEAMIGSLQDTHTLIVGAGGAAAAAVCALLDGGAERITLLNRSPDRAGHLAARFAGGDTVIDVVTTVAALHDRDLDLVVNASTVGLADHEPLPLDLSVPGRAGAAFDMVYRRDGTTPWVRHATRLGIPVADGVEMLLGQGAAAFERWFGPPAPLDVMRKALAR